MPRRMTEDQVRDEARDILGFSSIENANCGVGQLTSFNELGFAGVADRPDGWYLPDNKNDVAVILEAKSTKVNLGEPQIEELLKNVRITQSRYGKVIGVLYNGLDVKAYKGEAEIEVPNDLQHVNYYLSLYAHESIDKERIYSLTAKINNCLHFNFGIKNLYHRMIFTACALVAERYEAKLGQIKDMGYSTFHTRIHTVLAKSLEKDRNQNSKIDLLLEVYSEIKMNSTDNQKAINSFIDWVVEISECINSDYWNGEDVMGIFFNEFNRYKKKSESGQVFTPEHITDFMYRILEVDQDDKVLDAACGSGGFLVKAMSNMLQEAGGVKTAKAKSIKGKQLFGIEFDREIYALACANMLIHKDGKTNLEQLDSRTDDAGVWIKEKGITKVLMNPPFEKKYGCMDIVENVLDNVEKRTLCGFILPDKKLEKSSKKQVKRIFKNHSLIKIIKLPEDVFFNTGVTTSVFVFNAGVPQNGKEIFSCYMKEDGLVTVKNKGRHDIRKRWPAIEEYWTDVVRKQSGDPSCQWLKPSEHLSYQIPRKPFVVHDWHFRKAAMDLLIFSRDLNQKDFAAQIAEYVMYRARCTNDKGCLSLTLGENCPTKDTSLEDGNVSDIENIDFSKWKDFRISDLFEDALRGLVGTLQRIPEGQTPVVAAGGYNQGVSGYYDVEGTFENAITVSCNGAGCGSVFFHDYAFNINGDACVMVNKTELSHGANCFVACVMNGYLREKYSYDEKCSPELVLAETIKLPALLTGEPDWDYMDRYWMAVLKDSKVVFESFLELAC